MKKIIFDNLGKITFSLFILFIFLQIIFGDINKLWGVKTEAMMDAWSFEHILSGISIGFLIMSSNYKIFEKKIGFDPKKNKYKIFGFSLSFIFSICLGNYGTLFRNLSCRGNC